MPNKASIARPACLLVCYKPLARISKLREPWKPRRPCGEGNPSVLDSDLESTQIDTPGYAFDARGSSIDDDVRR